MNKEKLIAYVLKSIKEKKDLETFKKEYEKIPYQIINIYEILLENFSKMKKEYMQGESLKSLEKKYNLSSETIRKYLKYSDIEIKEANKEISFREKNKTEILEIYKKTNSLTKTCSEINKKYNIKLGRNHLKDFFKKENVKIDYSSNNYKKYNESFFEKIDTEEKAYWLGFLYADGCVQSSLSLELAEKDKEHLILFAKAICKNFDEKMLYSRTREIHYEHLNETRKYKTNHFQVSSKKIVNDLIKLGCVPNKSLILKFPTKEQVPEKLIHHFMRGYFDGDGHYGKGKKERIGLTGNEFFINEFVKVLKKEIKDFGKNRIYKRGNKVDFSKEGKTMEKIIDFLYEGANIFLERKRK